MRTPRIYSPQKLAENTELELDEQASHHCLKVLRMDVGRELILFNGDGACYPASIVAKSKKSATIRTSKKVEEAIESPLQTHLAVAVSRGDRFDYVIQKATELGATQITPLFTERTEVKLQGERLDKKVASWNKIIISACEQCGRNTLPSLNPPEQISHFLKVTEAEKKFVLHHRNTVSLQAEMQANSVILLIGPEGGLSEQEIELAHTYHYQNLSLGPRVLRTETAPLAALSIMQYLWGDI